MKHFKKIIAGILSLTLIIGASLSWQPNFANATTCDAGMAVG